MVGDLGHFRKSDGSTLPGVASVAMQQGAYVARRILADLEGRTSEPRSATVTGEVWPSSDEMLRLQSWDGSVSPAS